jgi:hypothetical protein
VGYYHPGLGRFVAEDPIGFDGGVNLYAYAKWNPVSNHDPLGLLEGSASFGFGATFVYAAFNGDNSQAGDGIDGSLAVTFSPSGVTFQGQLTAITDASGAFFGIGPQYGVGVGPESEPGYPGPQYSRWVGAGAGWGPGVAASANLVDNGDAITGGSGSFSGKGRARSALNYGVFEGEGVSKTWSYTIPWNRLMKWVVCP